MGEKEKERKRKEKRLLLCAFITTCCMCFYHITLYRVCYVVHNNNSIINLWLFRPAFAPTNARFLSRDPFKSFITNSHDLLSTLSSRTSSFGNFGSLACLSG